MTLFDNDPTLAALYAGVLANPAGDAERLVLADALEESADPNHKDLAAFIRTQYELDRIGPPRMCVEVSHVRTAWGPDYYIFDAPRQAGIKFGDRIDVELYARARHRDRHDGPKTINGLLVRSIQAPDSFDRDTVEIVAKRDSESVPYPKDRVGELRRTALLLVHAAGRKWIPPTDISAVLEGDGRRFFLGWWDPDLKWGAELDRGFASRYTGSWEHWVAHGTKLTQTLPFTHVTLRDRPEIRWHAEDRGRFRRYNFMNVNPPREAGIMRSARLEMGLIRDLSGAEALIMRELVSKSWPTVAKWTYPE